MRFVRFQAAVASRSGRFPGVFARVNRLAFDGRLSADDDRWRQEQNAWFHEHLVDPFAANPALVEGTRFTSSWFRTDASAFLGRTAGYLDLLDRYGVAWVELRGDDVGPAIAADEHQVTVVAVHDPGRLPANIHLVNRSDSSYGDDGATV